MFLKSSIKINYVNTCFCQKFFNSSFSVDNVLSDLNKNNCINLLRKSDPINKGIKGSKREAAVLVPMCVINNELSLLYIVRALSLNLNGGEVAFPGGIREESDGLVTLIHLVKIHFVCKFVMAIFYLNNKKNMMECPN